MKKSIKAALLSLLVFPGVGHLYLKKYIAGLLLAFSAAGATYFVVSKTVQIAFGIVEKIQGGSVPMDVATITELVSEQSRQGEQSMNTVLLVLLVCWVVGVVDSYRVGYLWEKSNTAAGEQKRSIKPNHHEHSQES